MKNKTLYIPFAKILKEFKKSKKNSYAHVYLCHRSATFAHLWDKNTEEIRQAAKTFMEETGVDTSLLKPELEGSCLFYSNSYQENNKLKTDFILWGRDKNKLSRKKRLQKI